jgi:Peptidase family C25/CARDB
LRLHLVEVWLDLTCGVKSEQTQQAFLLTFFTFEVNRVPNSSPKTTKMIRYFLPLVLLLLIQNTFAVEKPPEYTANECFDFTKATLQHHDESTLEYRFQIEVPDLNRLPKKFKYSTYLAAPLQTTVDGTLQDYSGLLFGKTLSKPTAFSKENLPDNITLPRSIPTVRTKLVDSFRGVSLFKVEIETTGQTTMAVNGTKQTFRVLVNDFSIKFTQSNNQSKKITESIESYDPFLKKILSPILLNPELLGESVSAVPPLENQEELQAWNQILQTALANGPVVKCMALKEGVYRINRQTFSDANITPDSIPVDQLQFYLDGKEIPAFTHQVTNNTLRDEAALYIYIPNDEVERRPYRCFWIVVGQEGIPPLRLTPETFQAGAVPEVNGTAMLQKQLFEPNEYHHNIARNAPNLRWGTSTIPNGTFEQIEFQIPKPDDLRPATIKIWTSSSDQRQRGEYNAYLNNVNLGTNPISGTKVLDATLEVPPGILKEGTNHLTFEVKKARNVKYPADLLFLSADLSYPAYTSDIPLNLPHTLTLDAPTSMTLVYPTANDKNRQPQFLLDINNSFSPMLYSMSRSGRDKQRCIYNAKKKDSRLISFTPTLALTPYQSKKITQAPLFAKKQPVDLLLVTHPLLVDELQRLGRYRSQSMQVELVTTDTIYNEFSYGEISFHAIANFVHHVYNNRKGKRLQSLLLVGEGSESWWEYTLAKDQISPNQVPVYGWLDPKNRVRSDDGYVSFSGNEGIPDAQVGRLSVATPEELSGIIDKIIAYEQNPPAGDWRDHHVFITDDEPEFLKVANAIVGKTFKGSNTPSFYPLQDQPYENYLRGFWRKRSVVMSDKILETLNHGARTITYLGHGGPNLWSGERIFHIRDIYQTANQGRAPILLAGSCDTGWVDYPMAPVNVSLSEHFLKHSTGGSIAAFIPVGATSSYEHNYILSGFFQGMMDHPDWNLGTLALYSKIYYFLYRNNRYACEQYLLMGDPTLSIVPTSPFPNLNITPSELLEITGQELTIKANVPDLDWGTGTFKIFDHQYNLVFQDNFRVRHGNINKTFSIPPYLHPSTHHLYVSASNSQLQYSQGLPITVGQADVTINWDREEPQKELQNIEEPPTLALTIKNDSPLPIVGASLDIYQGRTMELLGTTPLEIAANNDVQRHFKATVPRQVGSLLVRVTVPTSKNSDEKIILTQTTIVLSTPQGFSRYISVPTSAMEVLHGRAGDGTTFRFPVYNLTNTKLTNLSATLQYQDKDKLTDLSPPVPVETLDPEQRTIIEFHSDVDFNQGKATFILDLYENKETTNVPIQTEVFSTKISNGPDLEILSESIFLENEKAFAGNTVFVRFKVKNTGDSAAKNIVTNLYLDEPWLKKNLAPTALPWDSGNKISLLQPGQTHEFRLRWDPNNQDSGTRKIFATVLSNKIKGGEGNQKKTTYAFDVQLLQLPNLVLDVDNIKLDTNYLSPHLPVHLTIPIENRSENDFPLLSLP